VNIGVRAPGRVNLIGEHTDYNGGFVLPVAISLDTRLDIEPTLDSAVEITLASGERASFDLAATPNASGTWIDYTVGVARALADAGWPIAGFRGSVSSTLPMSVGLSSSAAFELASAWALLTANDARVNVDRMALARICQVAENMFVGVKSGLMDQFASSCGVAGHALLLDCRSLEYRTVALPPDVAIVVVNTGAERRLVSSEYNARAADCARGVQVLRNRGEAVTSLRDATVSMLDSARDDLGDVTYRRCRHIVDENERVLAAVQALESGDLQTVGELFAASHASLRDLFEVSSTELDIAVEIAAATPGVIAARMTGAGFGGCTVNLVESDAVDRLRAAIERNYEPRTGRRATVYDVAAVDGAGLIDGALFDARG